MPCCIADVCVSMCVHAGNACCGNPDKPDFVLSDVHMNVLVTGGTCKILAKI